MTVADRFALQEPSAYQPTQKAMMVNRREGQGFQIVVPQAAAFVLEVRSTKHFEKATREP